MKRTARAPLRSSCPPHPAQPSTASRTAASTASRTAASTASRTAASASRTAASTASTAASTADKTSARLTSLAATPRELATRDRAICRLATRAARTAGVTACLVAGVACVDSVAGPAGTSGTGEWSIADAVAYRDDLATHPGCTTDGMAYAPAGPAGYQCASKTYPVASEDTGKPIVLLIHGNSDTPDEWERWPKDAGAPMIAESLTGLGYRVMAVDLRIDMVDDPQSNNDTENAARNIDHGWATPIAQHFIRSAMEAEPDRRFTIIGFSLGATIIRDALRRIHLEGAMNPWQRLEDVVLLAGANHGVSTYAKLCGKNPTMRGQVACELGSRDSFAPTDFMNALNGPDGAFETPCSDGDSAYGATGVCGGNPVAYTTVVMRDIADGSYQDEFVSETSSALAGADNRLIELDDTDDTGYFFNGLLKNHYGSARSQAAIDIVVEVVGD